MFAVSSDGSDAELWKTSRIRIVDALIACMGAKRWCQHTSQLGVVGRRTWYVAVQIGFGRCEPMRKRWIMTRAASIAALREYE